MEEVIAGIVRHDHALLTLKVKLFAFRTLFLALVNHQFRPQRWSKAGERQGDEFNRVLGNKKALTTADVS